MSEDLDVELIPEEEADEDVHVYYIDQIDLAEHRRYVALDMARMAGPLPDKLVKLAQDIEKFLQGKTVRAVE